MRIGDRVQKLLAGLLVVAIVSPLVLLPGPRSGIAGLSIDTLFWLRDEAYGPRRGPAEARVALVLIDEDTYAVRPFKGKPKNVWTPFYADVLQAIGNAKPDVIGFDIALSTSIDDILRNYLTDYLKSHLPGTDVEALPSYDGSFLTALHTLGPAGRLVMTKFQGQGPPIEPPVQQIMMLGGRGNVRSANMDEDADGVVRRAPLVFRLSNGRTEPSFTAELARRIDKAPQGDELLLNWDGGYPFLAYSFADIYACAKEGNVDFFRSAFAAKVVLVATGLDVEDRLITSRRFINPPENLNGPRCTPRPADVPPPRVIARASLPGTYVYAEALDNLIHDEALRPLPVWAKLAWIAMFCAIAAVLAIGVPLLWGAAGLAALIVLDVLFATALFKLTVPPPLIESLAALLLSFGLMVAFRYTFTDRDKRRIRNMFSMYLSPSVIERLVETGQMPVLGGERREMTFFFSDIAGFTTMSEGADPTKLAPLLNAYLDGVCEIIFRYGGLVVDFAGDGVHALFGAPADQPDHAARGIAAAREVQAFIETFRTSEATKGVSFGHTRVGVHTGPALVGNLGSSKRLKYSALGDAVNTAARLEGLNKYFGTRICISEATRASAGEQDVRPIGDIVLKGRHEELRVYELLPRDAAQMPRVRRYVEAFNHMAEKLPDAEKLFADLQAEQPDDGCIRFHLARLAAGASGAYIVMAEK